MSSLDWPASVGIAQTLCALRVARIRRALRPILIILLGLSFPAVDFDLLFITARNYVCIFIPQFQPVALYHSVRPLVSSATS
jgi:hypothetical protein